MPTYDLNTIDAPWAQDIMGMEQGGAMHFTSRAAYIIVKQLKQVKASASSDSGCDALIANLKKVDHKKFAIALPSNEYTYDLAILNFAAHGLVQLSIPPENIDSMHSETDRSQMYSNKNLGGSIDSLRSYFVATIVDEIIPSLPYAELQQFIKASKKTMPTEIKPFIYKIAALIANRHSPSEQMKKTLNDLVERYLSAQYLTLFPGARSSLEALDSRVNDHNEQLCIAILEGDESRCQQLLEQGKANVNARDPDQRTPLHYAVGSANKEICELLVSHGANVKMSDCNKSTPLHIAARHIWESGCRFLVSKGAVVDARDDENFTPLYEAIASGYGRHAALDLSNLASTTENVRQVCSFLVAHGASLDPEDEEYQRLIQVAREQGHVGLEAQLRGQLQTRDAILCCHRSLALQSNQINTESFQTLFVRTESNQHIPEISNKILGCF